MAATGSRTIVIQGMPPHLERLCSEAVTPGHLLAVSSGAVIKHATADGVAAPLVAIESPHAHSETAANVDIAYASGDTVYHVQGQSGDVLYMWLATGNNAVDGVSGLYSNGDGTLKVVAAGAGVLEGALVGFPAESLNNASGSAARLKVRIA